MSDPVSVHDVAASLISRARYGVLGSMALHKLAYYCQGWHLAWHGEPLFHDPVEARFRGMAIPALFPDSEGRPTLDSWPAGNSGALTASQNETVRAVFAAYGGVVGRTMGEWQRNEAPWLMAHARATAETPYPEVRHDEMRAFFRAREDAPATATDYANRFMANYVD
ncbi:Panacea domain-containing protein [Arthrobacter sp. A2-55]|uniref:Panacea domain-containing protein n=1 Tax=Arthrobacter sp. A2-55 TaxID=2897337 RepID=UPI0021CDC3FE|nr:hypothetical protein [Arthrobacter sp. A2-55]MCU6481314.1 hypothetical protein [Arthrobacter sp. A2-55]